MGKLLGMTPLGEQRQEVVRGIVKEFPVTGQMS